MKGLTLPLLRVFAHFARVYSDRAVLPSESILILLQLQLDMQDLLDLHADEYFLAQADALLFQTTVDLLLAEYTRLGHQADALGLLLWPYMPKFHWLFHLAQRALFLSPRRAACLLGEDFMGEIKKVLQHCTRGTVLHEIPGKMFAKYRWGKYTQKKRVDRKM